METDRVGNGSTGEGLKTKVKVKGSPVDSFLFWFKGLVSEYLVWLGNFAAERGFGWIYIWGHWVYWFGCRISKEHAKRDRIGGILGK
jgi:hypothetical protein